MSEAAAPRETAVAGWPRGVLGDERLARRAAAGDSRAFAAIYRRYQADLYRYCLAIVGNAADAQDALQNTMVQALRALPGEERKINLKPWLYRVARNEAINLLRARRETAETDTELLVSSADVSGSIETRDRLRGLLSDLGNLPERQQSALVMRELAGLGFAEVAAALETSEATARQTVYEARLGLREMEKGREMSCAEVKRAISDADGRTLRRRDIRAHLRGCEDCRSFREAIGGRRADLAAISPLPAIAAAGVLQSVLGGAGGGAGAAGVGAGAAGTVAGKALATSTAAKSVVAATLLVAGIGAADRAGLISTPLPVGGGGHHAAQGGSPGNGSSAGGHGASFRQESGAGGASAGVGVGTAKGGAAKGAAHGGGSGTVNGAAANGARAEGAPGASGEMPPASAHGQESAESQGGGKANAHSHAGGNSQGSSHSHAGGNSGSHSNGSGSGNSTEHSSHAGGEGRHPETGGSTAPPHPSTPSGGNSGSVHGGAAPQEQTDNGAAGQLKLPKSNSEGNR
jgi:RNA polymerase sigma factor (sigma-70 family)